MNPVRIEYPCRYPVKIIGEANDDFIDAVVAVTRRHAPDLEDRDVRVSESEHGNYYSVSVMILAQNEDQLIELHNELKENPDVRLVI